jgi:fructokinase
VIVVCGEALVDLTVEPSRGPGDAPRYRASPGGSPANTAVGLARLGTPSALLGRLAGDRFGQLLRRHLTGSGVDVQYCVEAAEPTTLAVVDIAADGGARYAFYVEGTADWQWREAELPAQWPADVRALHAGSLALALPPGGPVLESVLARERDSRTISLDPNVRPALVGDRSTYRDKLERWVRLAHLVKISVEDLDWVYPGEPPAMVARRWCAAGVPLVVVTAGPDGAQGYPAGAEPVQVAGEQVDTVDTVGAGDAFSAGLLDWLHRHGRLGRPDGLGQWAQGELATALSFAGRVAAVTCTRAGADPPYRNELSTGQRSSIVGGESAERW